MIVLSSSTVQWRIQGRSSPPTLSLNQTEAQKSIKFFLEIKPPLSQGLDDQAPPPQNPLI